MIFFELWPSVIAGLTVSVLHAAIPTHWLPFVLAGRSQSWSYKKTISILLIAGLGHVLTTTLIGAAVVWFGVTLNSNFESILIYLSAFSVFCFGLYNIIQYKRGYQHSHCDHVHHHNHDHTRFAKDGWAILSLLSLLTFSPCEAFLPVYVSAWPLGWSGFLVLSVTLAVGTLSAMILFTTLMHISFKKFNDQFKFQWLENHEKLVTGLVLILLALVICLTHVLFPHQH